MYVVLFPKSLLENILSRNNRVHLGPRNRALGEKGRSRAYLFQPEASPSTPRVTLGLCQAENQVRNHWEQSVCSALPQKSESGSPLPVSQHEWGFFRVSLSTWLPLNLLHSGEKAVGAMLVVTLSVFSGDNLPWTSELVIFFKGSFFYR